MLHFNEHWPPSTVITLEIRYPILNTKVEICLQMIPRVIWNIEISLRAKVICHEIWNQILQLKMSTLFVFGQEIFSWFIWLQVFTLHQNIQLAQQLTKKMPIKFELFARFPQITQSFAYFLWKDDQTFSYQISLCLMNSFCAMNSTRNRYQLNFLQCC